MKVLNIKVLEHGRSKAHRQNLFAKPANLHNQGHLHNPITNVNTKLKEIIIPLKLKRPQQGASADAHKAYKASTLAIRSPQAKQTRGNKKGKDPIKIDGQILEYYTYKQCFVIQIKFAIAARAGLSKRLLILYVWDVCARRLHAWQQ